MDKPEGLSLLQGVRRDFRGKVETDYSVFLHCYFYNGRVQSCRERSQVTLTSGGDGLYSGGMVSYGEQ